MATDVAIFDWSSNVGVRVYALEKNDSDVGTWEGVGDFSLEPEVDTANQCFMLAHDFFGTYDFVYSVFTGTRFNGSCKVQLFTDIDPVDTGHSTSLRWSTSNIEDSFLDFHTDIEGGNFELALITWFSDATTAEASVLEWATTVAESEAKVGVLSWASDVAGIPAENSFVLEFFSDVGGSEVSYLRWSSTARQRGTPLQGAELVLVYANTVDNALVIPTEFAAPIAQQLIIDGWMGGEPVQGALVMTAGLTDPIVQALDITSALVDSVAQRLEAKYDIQDFDVLTKTLDFIYTLMGPTTVQADPSVVLTVGNNQELSVASASVNMDEGQYAWTCQVELSDPGYYYLFGPNEPFSLDLDGEYYGFLLDSKALARTSQVNIKVTLNGVSPSAIHAAPRAPKITKTWDIPMLASQVVKEVLNDSGIIWEIIDWAIPAFRLGVQNSTPMEIVQLIAKAAGAVVMTDPDGTLRVRYKFPVSPPDYDSVSPDQEYADEEHTFSTTENSTPVVVVNKLRVMDVVAGAAQDSVEFVADPGDPTKGILRVWPRPWRDTFTVTHTSNNQVSIVPLGEFTEQLTEVIEVLGSKGRTAKPIYQLYEVVWLFKDLGGLVFEPNTNEFTTDDPVNKESLVRFTYITRFFEFRVVAYTGAIVQFLIGDPE